MFLFTKKRHRLSILYKSGHYVNVSVVDFNIKTTDGVLTSLKWEDPRPKIFHIGINEIESIWYR